MSYLLLLPATLSFWLLGAHYLRQYQTESTFVNLFLLTLSVLAPFLFIMKNRQLLRSMQLLLLVAAMVWVGTGWELFRERVRDRRPYRALIIIMTSVTAFTVGSALLLELPPIKRRYPARGPKP